MKHQIIQSGKRSKFKTEKSSILSFPSTCKDITGNFVQNEASLDWLLLSELTKET